ncbi:hypothetical protein IVB30_42930 [Bradyrhizobium sp. 200]|uniref:hypothetical protein n=1 Tax=Bradyrhizobium sp. 200 TaxID=2782665 RepID=UPI001FFED8E2|nr:hypothetical protein [Bradyrhizobium sp. 200]UPJ54674.1 hypothetical protein IVB30_42930 [Bradyrhizobium sp. 200]
MIRKSIVSSRVIAPDSSRWSAMSGFAGKAVETVSDFASIIHNLVLDVRDCYRPELHYMRGPGPKWRAKHQPWLKFDSATSDWHRRMR